MPNETTREKKVSHIFLVKEATNEELGQVTAVVSVFGVIDDGNDRIWKGAFAKTLLEFSGRVKVLDQHNTDSTDRILGRPIEMHEAGADELPQEVKDAFPEATGGLVVTIQFNMKTQAGSEAFWRISAGDLTEYSIGYQAFDSDISEEMVAGKKVRVRNIRTIKLWEFSPVIWGMNPATATISSKDNPMPDKPKEYVTETDEVMTPGMPEEEGEPTERLGDKIHACMSRSFACLLAWLYEDGWLSFEEFTALQTAGNTHLNAFRMEMPSDVVMREYEDQFYYSLMSGTPVLDGKSLPVGTPIDTKAKENQPAAPSPEPEVAGPVKTPPTIDELKARATALTQRMQIIQGVQ